MNNLDVAAVGDFVVDRVVNLSEVSQQKIDLWEEEDWFPEEGESKAADVPSEVDEYVEEEYAGGKAANQALAASLGGAKTGYFAETSHLPTSLEYMEQRQVDLSGINHVENGRNIGYVFVDEEGENRIAADINTLTGKDYIDRNQESILDAEVLLVTNGMSIGSLEHLLGKVEEEGSEVVLDPSPLSQVERALTPAVDYITPNSHEHSELEGEMNGSYTVLKTSSEGVKIDGERQVYSPEVSSVVDTTAAGDTLNGYLAAELSQGRELPAALEKACRAASISIQYEGAQPSIPEL